MPSSASSSFPAQPHGPPRYPHGLPPSYIAHLRLLIHQWLQDQLAPPDEGFPGPSNRVADRPLWSDDRLAEVQRAVIACILGGNDGTEERQGILGCDWAEWAKGGIKRKKAFRREVDKGKETEIGEKVQVSTESGTARGTAFRLPVHLHLPTALGSVVSTPTKFSRPPSVASSTRSRDASPSKPKAGEEGVEQNHVKTTDRIGTDTDAKLDRWCDTISQLKGFVPFDSCTTQPESWEVLNGEFDMHQNTVHTNYCPT